MEAKKGITSISLISTVAQIFNSMPAVKKRYSEVHQLIKLYYIIPLTSVLFERSFSAMRQLKTWLRANAWRNHLK